MDAKSAPRSADRRIAALAASQHGVVSSAQLRGAGLARGGIEHRVRQGRLHRVHRGVYAVGHPLLGIRGRWLAAVLACGTGAALSHGTAAALWGMRPTTTAPVDITVPSRAGRRRRRGIVIHRVEALPQAEIVRHDEIPVTSSARTLLDLARVVPRSSLERAVDRAEQLRIFDLYAVRAVLLRHVGAVGCVSLAAVLAQREEGTTLTRSELEERFLALCAEHRLTRPLANAQLHGVEVDFLWRGERLVVETDGRRSHATYAAFERDRARDARLTALGYRVVRFTYRQVVDEPDRVARLVETLLGTAAA